MRVRDINSKEAHVLVGKMLEQLTAEHEAGRPPRLMVLELAVGIDEDIIPNTLRIRAEPGEDGDPGYLAFLPEESNCDHCADQAMLGELLSERTEEMLGDD